MKFVLHILKKKLQSEKHCAEVHSKLTMDKRFCESARMAKERIPQLEKAIEILSSNRRDILEKFITEIKTEFHDQNWDYLTFIADRVMEREATTTQPEASHKSTLRPIGSCIDKKPF